MKDDDDWLTGNDWGVKILGMYTHTYTEKIGGRTSVCIQQPRDRWQCQAAGGCVEEPAIRVDGTFRPCK
jgi:hypothetical protein